MKAPKLSIIILNFKSAGLVKYCVAGLFNEKHNIDFEVIVVDNASGDNCLQNIKQKWPQVITIQLSQNSGYAAGNNAGISKAVGEYVMILNPDVAVMSGGLEAIVKFMDDNPHTGLAAPKLRNPDGTIQMSSFHFPHFWLPIFRRTPLGLTKSARLQVQRYLMEDWDHATNKKVDWLLGACLIVRRQALNEVGALDEQYFLYVEDTDWCRRFWEKGWEVFYVADVSMVHFHQRLSADASFMGLFNKITWIHISSWMKYFKKWGLHVPHPSSDH